MVVAVGDLVEAFRARLIRTPLSGGPIWAEVGTSGPWRPPPSPRRPIASAARLITWPST